jgi:hypothetical protein
MRYYVRCELTIHIMHHILNYMDTKILHLMKFRLYQYV